MARKPSNVIRVVVDASVLFSGFHSQTGYAHDLVNLAFDHKVTVVISPYIRKETQITLARKSPGRLPMLKEFLRIAQIESVNDLSEKEISSVEEYVEEKDAPVVALAIREQVDYLVTYDKKHILRDDVIEKSGLHICIPQIVVEAITGY